MPSLRIPSLRIPFLRIRWPSEYPSFTLWLLDQTHITVTAVTALVVVSTWDAHVAWFASGALLSSLTAKIIKSSIRQPRPPPPPAPPLIKPLKPSPSPSSSPSPSPSSFSPSSSPSPSSASTSSSKHGKTASPRPKRTYGMPSTHSTALTFYMNYLLPLVLSFDLSRHLSRPSPVHASVEVVVKSLLNVGVLGYWAAGLWSRVELGYHTPTQVLAGVVLGSLLAVGWRMVWMESPGLRVGLQGFIDVVWRETAGKVVGRI